MLQTRGGRQRKFLTLPQVHVAFRHARDGPTAGSPERDDGLPQGNDRLKPAS